MGITTEQLDRWARAYIEAERLPEGELTHTHPLWWAVEQFMHLESLQLAEDAWQGIFEVLSRTSDPEVLCVLAAGPLEDLIRLWGPEFIDRIEVQARQSPAFRELLRGVWESGDRNVCARVAHAKGHHAA